MWMRNKLEKEGHNRTFISSKISLYYILDKKGDMTHYGANVFKEENKKITMTC